MPSAQLATRLLETFLGELDDQLAVMNRDLLALESAPADRELLQSLFRVAHTLKGAAHAANVPAVSERCHALEGTLAEARDGRRALGPDDFADFFHAADALALEARRLRGTPRLADPADLAAPPQGGRTESFRAATEPPKEQLRVDAQHIDDLVSFSGQLLTEGNRIAERQRELQALHARAAQCASHWSVAGRRASGMLERAGSPAAARALLDVEGELDGLVRATARIAVSGASDARTLSRTAQDGVRRARALRFRPFADVCAALPRAVRDLAGATGKEVRLDVRGTEVEADRAVLDGLREAVLQLVRNAVDHGIEPPAVRERMGKPRSGTVKVSAAIEGERLVVTVADDGAGLAVDAIRERLRQRGREAPDDERQLGRALLHGGVSTKPGVTAISGRGVGFDIVRKAVERMHGSMCVTWTPGAGATFTLECPPSLLSVRALTVSTGGQLVALPTSAVDRLLRVRAPDVRRMEGRERVAVAGEMLPLIPLARLLPPLVERATSEPRCAVVVRAGDRRVAVTVDAFVDEHELVLRPLRAGAASLPLLSGAALRSDGRVVLVVNPGMLVDAGVGDAGPAAAGVAATPALPSRRRILVADDAITTRTLLQGILETAGYEVTSACDGQDAWTRLQADGADVVIADVDMPGLDGVALCGAIHGSARFRDLPVVLITSLERDIERVRGLGAGAAAYIGKSRFDQHNLLDVIEQLLPQAATS